MSDYSNILQDLKALNLEKAFPVFIPSQNREVQFTPLTVKQQKDIIKGALDAATSNVLFNSVTNDIIKSNSSEPIDYLILDKTSILVHFRLQALGDQIKLPDPDDDNVEYDVNLRDHANTFPTMTLAPEVLQETIVYSNITGALRTPPLSIDTKFNDDTKKSLEQVQSGDLSDTIGDLFIFELIKFLHTLTIGEKTVVVSDLSIPQAVSLVENLPLMLSNKIITFIDRVREFEQGFSNVKTADKSLELPIDATFFNTT